MSAPSLLRLLLQREREAAEMEQRDGVHWTHNPSLRCRRRDRSRLPATEKQKDPREAILLRRRTGKREEQGLRGNTSQSRDSSLPFPLKNPDEGQQSCSRGLTAAGMQQPRLK